MKILVIQLTRLGDILCTFPTLSALRRENPEAEIHFLVRKRFAEAAKLASVDHLWQFDTRAVIGGLVTEEDQISGALQKVSAFIHTLRAEKFDRIINLSFSPSSSFITHLISQNNTPVSGYTRTEDFYLSVPDQPSQYFRAQVGIEKSNRLHVVDLMGWIARVQIEKGDLALDTIEARTGIVCHLGASQKHKAWPATSWVAFLRKLASHQNEKIVLVGASEEKDLAHEIAVQVGSDKIINQVGLTTWTDLIFLLRRTALYVGADSGPMHGASLAGVPVLNLSVGHVRFWETGPLTQGSRVLVSAEPGGLMSDFVFDHAMDMLSCQNKMTNAYFCTGTRGVRYQFNGSEQAPGSLHDAWSMVEWMYFDGEQPAMRGDLPAICRQAAEAAELAIQQLDVLEKNPEKTDVVGILDNLDEIISLFGQNIKPLGPLVDLFRSQKENIPPGERDEIFSKTRQCYTTLRQSLTALQPEERV